MSANYCIMHERRVNKHIESRTLLPTIFSSKEEAYNYMCKVGRDDNRNGFAAASLTDDYLILLKEYDGVCLFSDYKIVETDF